MKCPKCDEDMEWFKEDQLYSCWKCYYKIGVDKNTTLFD